MKKFFDFQAILNAASREKNEDEAEPEYPELAAITAGAYSQAGLPDGNSQILAFGPSALSRVVVLGNLPNRWLTSKTKEIITSSNGWGK